MVTCLRAVSHDFAVAVAGVAAAAVADILQIREHKTALANYETQDMGKPVDEAEWDMVRHTQQLVNPLLFYPVTFSQQAQPQPSIGHTTCSPAVSTAHTDHPGSSPCTHRQQYMPLLSLWMPSTT
jgi:hypothetical protein